MSSKYLQQTASSNEAINLRCNDLTVDGTFTGPAPVIPDPLVVNSLGVNVIASFTSALTTVELDTLNAVSQATSPTTAVTLDAESGVITTQTMVTATEGVTLFTFNNNLIDANTVIQSTIQSYSGALDGSVGYPVVQIFYTGTPGQATVQVVNSYSVNPLNGILKIHFRLIHLTPP